MERKQTIPAVILAAIVLFSGIFGIRGDLFGQNAATAALGHPIVAETAQEKAADAPSDMIREVIREPRKVKPLPSNLVDSETLWLARVIYSETKRPEEMELVAWVVRNRVETKYRGAMTYQDAVLDPFQFSAFNPGRKRQFYSNLTTQSNAAGFQAAVGIAYSVRHADAEYRPFSKNTRHFYSERSMVGVRHPAWAKGGKQVIPQRPFQLDELRFRFFENVA